MPIPKKAVAFVTPLVLAAATLGAVVGNASASDQIDCQADFVSLVVKNGSNQYFECGESADGVLRQTFSSKNPWIVDPAAPALFITPPASPAGAVGQIFTGQAQGVGVISSADNTGAERDSISRNETLTLKKDVLAQNFRSLKLGVRVLQADTVIQVRAEDGDGNPVGTATSAKLTTGSTEVDFFSGAGEVDAAAFTIGVTQGAFSIDGKRTTRFYLTDVTAPGPVSALTVDEVTFESVTLSWTSPTEDEPFDVVVERNGVVVSPAGFGQESFTDSTVEAGTDYTYAVYTVDESGNESARETVTVKTDPEPDTTPPGQVTELRVVVDGETVNSIELAWTNPTDEDLAEVIVRRKEGATAPTLPGDGTGVPLASPTATSVVDFPLDPGKQYSYAVFTRDAVPNTNNDGVTVSGKTEDAILDGVPLVAFEEFDNGQTLRSEITFDASAGDCNATAIPYTQVLAQVDFELYSLSADWIVPLKTDIIPNSNPATEYGNCLFEWTTTATGVDYSLTPLMDYDGDAGPKDPEAIPGCEWVGEVAQAPPTEYVGTDRPFCLVTDGFENGEKTTTVLVWNDPKRFT
jgi:hypothetical protein